MCHRFTLFATIDEIKTRYSISTVTIEWEPRYNISITDNVLVVTKSEELQLNKFKRWLIPFWAKDYKIGYKNGNARCETVDSKPTFKYAFLTRHCLIPANWFFEWEKIDWKSIPYLFRLKSKEIFSFAWLYEERKSSKWEIYNTCTILTWESNSLVARVHDRMPIILKKEDEMKWLESRKMSQVIDLFEPYDPIEMDCIRVSSYVNSSKNQWPALFVSD